MITLLTLADETCQVKSANAGPPVLNQYCLVTGMEQYTAQYVPVNLRSQQLIKALLQALGRRLERFRVEVDLSAHPIGEELRVNFRSQASGKGINLTGVEEMWRQGRYQDAIRQLDEGTAHLETMRGKVLCLQNSITTKSAACDPQALISKKHGDALERNPGLEYRPCKGIAEPVRMAALHFCQSEQGLKSPLPFSDRAVQF
jgi:hypothetical protein